jgi:hypothetical protein
MRHRALDAGHGKLRGMNNSRVVSCAVVCNIVGPAGNRLALAQLWKIVVEPKEPMSADCCESVEPFLKERALCCGECFRLR